MTALQIEWNRKRLAMGILLIAAGILAPVVMTVNDFRVYPLMHESLSSGNQGLLLAAAFRLVLLNILRALPHYLGVFLLSQSLQFRRHEKNWYWLQGLTMLFILYAVYQVIGIIHQIRYDFGGPALMTLLAILILARFHLSYIAIGKQAMIVVLVLAAVQWLDVVPFLTSLGFGRGETSMDLKMTASFLGAEELLAYSAALLFMILMVNALLVGKILKDQHQLMRHMDHHQVMEQQLMKTRIQALEARGFQEIQSLVHDMKTPLTSIQVLAGVSEIITENEKIKDYMVRVTQGVDALNAMITEILHEDKVKPITTAMFFDRVFAHLSAHPCREKIIYQNNCPEKRLLLNGIRMTRALINLIVNAEEAVDPVTGKISIQVKSLPDNKIGISVEDDGTGINESDWEVIWSPGFSRSSSTGLGLPFVQKIISAHDGTIAFESKPGEGTRVSLTLPEVTDS